MTMTAAGDRVIRLGASALALTGLEVLTDAGLLAEIKAEFAARGRDEKGNFPER